MDSPMHVVLGICSGIAAYKTPDLIRLLRKRSIEVKTVLTADAVHLVGIEALRTVSAQPVYMDGVQSSYDMDHIRLAEWGQWLVICPATANTIAKIAHGIADNLLSTLALSFEGRIVIVPAMNTLMWENTATKANVETLARRGVRVLPVDEGELACGTRGAGRMIALDGIVEAVAGLNAPRILKGVRVLISSGPTEEAIDPVRVITNRSSGRMGAALAAQACAMGAEVTVVSGPSVVPVTGAARRIDVRTAAEMQAAMEREFDTADVCLMAAAVSDYRPEHQAEHKLAREQSKECVIRLVPNPDILAALGARRRDGQVLVGFALETHSGLERAREKMVKKHCDMLVLNFADSSLGLATSEATILYTDREPETLGCLEKSSLAGRLLSRVAQRLGRVPAAGGSGPNP